MDVSQLSAENNMRVNGLAFKSDYWPLKAHYNTCHIPNSYTDEAKGAMQGAEGAHHMLKNTSTCRTSDLQVMWQSHCGFQHF